MYETKRIQADAGMPLAVDGIKSYRKRLVGQMKHMATTQSITLFVGAMLLTVICAGCSLFEPPPEPVEQVAVAPEEQVEPEPRLVSVRDGQISGFGDMANRDSVPYYSRAAISLRQHTFIEEDGSDFDPQISEDGSRMIFASTRHNLMPDIYIKSVDGVAVTQLTSDPASDIHPAFSPDGTRVAFASNRTGNWDIWIMGVDGQHPIQVTAGEADDVHPSWSPDGSRLVYCSLPRSGRWELWLADASYDSTKRFVGYGVFPEWAPVGNTILYQRARERGSRWFSVWTLELINGEPRYPTEVAASPDFALISPAWSRDGNKIAFTARVPPEAGGGEAGMADIWVVNSDGRSRIRLTDGHSLNYGPCWSPSGRVFFTSAREGYETIWSLLPLETTEGGLEASAGSSPDTLARIGQ